MRTRSPGTIRSCFAMVWASMLLLPPVVRPQEPPQAAPIPLGTAVRIWAPTVVQGRLEGRLVGWDEGSLLVTINGLAPMRVPRQAVTRLNMVTGSRRPILKGAIIGAAIGAATFQTSVSNTNCQNAISACFTSRGQALGAGLVGGGLVGAAIGALIKSDRWAPVPLERLRVSVAPTRGPGVAVSGSIEWR